MRGLAEKISFGGTTQIRLSIIIMAENNTENTSPTYVMDLPEGRVDPGVEDLLDTLSDRTTGLPYDSEEVQAIMRRIVDLKIQLHHLEEKIADYATDPEAADNAMDEFIETKLVAIEKEIDQEGNKLRRELSPSLVLEDKDPEYIAEVQKLADAVRDRRLIDASFKIQIYMQIEIKKNHPKLEKVAEEHYASMDKALCALVGNARLKQEAETLLEDKVPLI